MAKALAELDRVDRLHGLGAPVAAPRRRTRRPRIDLTACVAFVVVLVFLALGVPRLVFVPGSAMPAADAFDPPLRADSAYPAPSPRRALGRSAT